MSEQNKFSNLQRRNSAVMAKYEWTSSLMNMQKSGNEIHDRRTKTHRKANEFLQGLLQKRSDGSLLDDNGTIDRYEKFLRFKSNLNDDDMLSEFDRRLRALNRERRQKQLTSNDLQISQEPTDRDQRQKRAMPVGVQTLRETTDRDQRLKRSISQGTESDVQTTDRDLRLNRSISQRTESDIQPTDRDQRLNRSISQRTESDIQTTDRDLLLNRSISQETESDIQTTNKKQLLHQRSLPVDFEVSRETESDIQSLKPTDRIKSLSKSTITSNNSLLSNISAETNPSQVRFSINEYETSSLSPSSSSSDHSITKTVHRPKVRRADGTEVVVNPPRRLRRASSDILIFNHCHFPRSLKLRERMNMNVIPEKQEPPPPPTTTKQYDHSQVFELLDQIENESSSAHFATMLDQLSLSTVPIDRIDDNNNNVSFIDNDENENENEDTIPIYPNLFDQPTLSQEYYTTLDINIDNPKNVFLYTMTIGIVQLSPSLIVPYSILNGRRPLLQLSVQTNFQKIHCKQPKHTSQVTAIDSTINTELLKENDIILKINDQSVWNLTTENIQDILQESNDCLLTVVRLCQPLV